jgi:hypothetical protein
MADVVPDEQGLSGHEAEAIEIQRGPAGERSKPDRMRWMGAIYMKQGPGLCRGDGTNGSVR